MIQGGSQGSILCNVCPWPISCSMVSQRFHAESSNMATRQTAYGPLGHLRSRRPKTSHPRTEPHMERGTMGFVLGKNEVIIYHVQHYQFRWMIHPIYDLS